MFVGEHPLEEFVEYELLPEFMFDPFVEGVFVHRNRQGVLFVYSTEPDYSDEIF